MKLLGKILLAFTALMIFVSITLWILAKNIKPETIKQLVSNKITAITHKQRQIDGTISWQLFPRPGLKFNKIHIGNENLNDNYSLLIDTLLLNLKITPLLKGHFVFSEINIDGLKLFINQENNEKPLSSEKKANQYNTTTYPNEQFAIQKLLLSHGQIILNSKGHSTVLKNIQIGAEQFNLKNSPFSVQIKAKLTDAAFLQTAKANINFKGRVSLSPSIIDELNSGISKSSIEGQLQIQNILLNQFAIKKINTTLKTHKRDIQFNPLTLSLYNGESIGDMDYVIATQQLLINQTATNLDGKQLITSLLKHPAISGNLDYSIHASIPLKALSIESLVSKGTITLKDGEVYNINLDQLLNNLKVKLNSLMTETPDNIKKLTQSADWDQNKNTQGNTKFKLANFKFQLQTGAISSDSFLLQTDKLQVNGEGRINLLNQEINSNIKATLNDNSTDNTLQKIQQALGGYFPLVVSGTVENPIVLPDFKAISPVLSSLAIKSALTKPLKIIQKPLKELIH
ncbi:AsmA family protein [Legionella pneumophila]|uniref:AsmA family protein n=1 Tax=Legionella pneumophila TaxID=446 RepID=UPI0005C432B9|nr:AsmA family protein [Legionella pneumophila]GAN29392.1 asmA family protein [Legionella pneumophila]